MCSNTKKKIAATLRQLMSKRSFDRITVKALMDTTGMQRQSFYYHFQDTRQVLMWICREELFSPLLQSQLALPEWLVYAMELLDRDRPFFRRVLAAVQTDFVQELSEQSTTPRVAGLLYGTSQLQDLSGKQRFVVQIVTNALVDPLLRFTQSHFPLDAADAQQKLQYLLAELKSGCGHSE